MFHKLVRARNGACKFHLQNELQCPKRCVDTFCVSMAQKRGTVLRATSHVVGVPLLHVRSGGGRACSAFCFLFSSRCNADPSPNWYTQNLHFETGVLAPGIAFLDDAAGMCGKQKINFLTGSYCFRQQYWKNRMGEILPRWERVNCPIRLYAPVRSTCFLEEIAYPMCDVSLCTTISGPCQQAEWAMVCTVCAWTILSLVSHMEFHCLCKIPRLEIFLPPQHFSLRVLHAIGFSVKYSFICFIVQLQKTSNRCQRTFAFWRCEQNKVY